jgi:murein DD-endopeptidase MepM/ murein hydrolase activator NlpD
MIINLFLFTFIKAECATLDTLSINTDHRNIFLRVDTSVSKQICPVVGKVISPFGYRGRHRHTGADIKLHRGDTVVATINGVVTMSCRYYGYGNLIIIKHDEGVETYYSHLSKCLVEKGDTVFAGQAVGLGGRTGRATTDHLHFEVRKNKKPLNPESYFCFSTNSTKKPLLGKATELFIASDKKSETKEQKLKEELTDNIINTESVSGDSESIVTVQKGDTLYALAKKHGTTIKQLQELNGLKGSALKIGLKLKIK